MSQQDETPEPAFPCDWVCFQPETGNQVIRQQWAGMTLRDYFAAKGMTVIMAPGGCCDWSTIATQAYALADAMMKARTTQPEAVDL